LYDSVERGERSAEIAERLHRMQGIVEIVWRQLFFEECPRVVPFGSVAYDLATSSSDWDYALELPEELAPQGKVFRAKLRQHLCDRGFTTYWKTADQFQLQTLKWKFKGDKVQSSLNVSSTEAMALAMGTTRYLQEFYARNEDMKEPVRTVATLLRKAKHMAVCGGVSHPFKICQSVFNVRLFHRSPGRL
jgi:hypothetical protein